MSVCFELINAFNSSNLSKTAVHFTTSKFLFVSFWSPILFFTYNSTGSSKISKNSSNSFFFSSASFILWSIISVNCSNASLYKG